MVKRYNFFADEAVCSDDNSSDEEEDDDEVEDQDEDEEDISNYSQDPPPPPPKRKRLIKNSERTAVTSAPAAAVTNPVRGRPKGKTAAVKEVEKPPGDPTYPVNAFSLTITKSGKDISLDCLDIVDAFIKQYCLQGLVATEVGKKKFQLHLQAVIRLHYPKSKDFCVKLSKIIKIQLPNKGVGHKISYSCLCFLFVSNLKYHPGYFETMPRRSNLCRND